MRVYTAHTRATRPPVLVREGFAWGGLILGPLWLLSHRAWIAALLTACAAAAILALTDDAVRVVLILALAWMLGLFGNDLRRWSLDRAGFTLVHVVAAANGDAALARLLDRRPDLIADALR